ncbi:MAG: immunoglobulin domain-containing protein [Opitutaceae bacterium]|nr:immunoglobulin domain-containing protein [Opitutaceae bacterium]
MSPPRRFPWVCLTALTLLLAPAPRGRAADAPVSPGSLPEVAWVLDLLRETSGNKILSGQQERIDWFGLDNEVNFDFVRQATGLTPAVRGFDFMFYTHSAGGRQGQRAAERAIVWARKGGVVQFCVHWFVDTGSAPGNPKFYTNETTFDIRQALVTGTPENVELLREMDLMAEELKLLREARVPVIWRPFHECSGGWFWWGAKGPEPFKQAYRLMFDRFTRLHGLNNLIWCYNPTETTGALEAWYPGDDVVDLIGLDIYPSAGSHPHYASVYQHFRDFTGGRKPVTLTENGAIPDLDAMFAAGAGWPSFCTWNGFESDSAQNSASFLRRAYQDPRTITLETMPDVYRRLSQPPFITVAPSATQVRTGDTLALAVTVRGSGPLSYQWTKDGSPVPGATGPTLSFARAAVTDAGAYGVTVRNGFGEATSAAAALTVTENHPPPLPAALANLSTRAALATHGDVLIVGFVVHGSGAKPLLLRAIGPTLAAYGVTNPLADPKITLVSSAGAWVAENDAWQAGAPPGAMEAAFAGVGAFALPTGSQDAALRITLPPGGYTALIQSADAVSAGTVLAEIYDAATDHAVRLINLSARGSASASQPLIVGFVVTPPAHPGLLVRAAGPALTPFGVSGALASPQLTLTTAAGVTLAGNAGWSTDPVAALDLTTRSSQVGAFPFNGGSRDSALVTAQSPGGYTAIVTGAGSARGVTLVEVYQLP